MNTTRHTAAPVAEVRGLWKSYGGVPVLSDVHIDIAPGEIHALVGGNGAGKSTLMKCITGVVTPDAGDIVIGGKTIRALTLQQAHANHVYMVPQEPQLFGHLSVFENIALSLDRRITRREVAATIATLSSPIDLDARANDLSISDQQLVELARGMNREAKLLIVDEPTAALTAKEVDLLFEQLRKLAANGVGIFYVSHRLSEIFALCDRVSVLRDGQVTLQGATSDFTRPELVHAIAPDTTDRSGPVRATACGVEPALSLRSLSGQGFTTVDLDVFPGEVLGIAGVLGSGRTELCDTVFGLRPGEGEVILAGRPYDRRSPQASVRRGLSYVPEDRHAHGVFLGATIAENTTVSILDRIAVGGLIKRGAEENVTHALSESLSVQKGARSRKVGALSGGNQQKIALAKALAIEPQVIILDEPSRGVDVGARSDLYRLIEAMAASGLAVLLISSDFEEIVELSTRVLIMREGRIVGELTGAQINFANVRDGAFASEEVAS